MTESRWIKLSERKPDLPYKNHIYFCNFERIERCPWSNVYPPEWATHWLDLQLPELPKEEKPNTDFIPKSTESVRRPDPDWKRLDESFNKFLYNPGDRSSIYDFIEDVYIFLKVKYGK